MDSPPTSSCCSGGQLRGSAARPAPAAGRRNMSRFRKNILVIVRDECVGSKRGCQELEWYTNPHAPTSKHGITPRDLIQKGQGNGEISGTTFGSKESWPSAPRSVYLVRLKVISEFSQAVKLGPLNLRHTYVFCLLLPGCVLRKASPKKKPKPGPSPSKPEPKTKVLKRPGTLKRPSASPRVVPLTRTPDSPASQHQEERNDGDDDDAILSSQPSLPRS